MIIDLKNTVSIYDSFKNVSQFQLISSFLMSFSHTDGWTITKSTRSETALE